MATITNASFRGRARDRPTRVGFPDAHHSTRWRRMPFPDLPCLALAEALVPPVDILACLVPGDERAGRTRQGLDGRERAPGPEPIAENELPTNLWKVDPPATQPAGCQPTY